MYGNILTAAGGFFLAAQGHINFGLLLATLAGSSLAIASGCVFNNYLDRSIDLRMSRTKKRALVTGTISPRIALLYATVLGLIGFALLIALTNRVTVLVGLTGIIFYVLIYGYFKRHWVHGTIVGSVSGAIPIVAGYTAVTANFDMGALLLFLIMVTWQMPHFYAIAMYRSKEYEAADIPVLPLKKGMRNTQLTILSYIGAFLAACALLTLYGYAGFAYLSVMTILGVMWFYRGYTTLDTLDSDRWGRKMFGFSLIVILGLSIMLSVGSILP